MRSAAMVAGADLVLGVFTKPVDDTEDGGE